MDSLTQSLNLQVDITASLYETLSDMAGGLREFNSKMAKKTDAATQLANSLQTLKLNFDSNSTILKSQSIAGRDQSRALVDVSKKIIQNNNQNIKLINESINSVNIKSDVASLRQISNNLKIAVEDNSINFIDSSEILEIVANIDQNALKSAAEHLLEVSNTKTIPQKLADPNQVDSLNSATQNISDNAKD